MNRQKHLYILGIPNFGIGLLWAMNLTLIPMLVNSFEVTNQQAGLLISMGAFTGIFVPYLVGIMSDRSRFKMGKRKPFMLIGSVVATISLMIMPFASGYWMLFLISFLFYFSLNFYQSPYYSLIPEVAGEHHLGLANGFANVVSVLGGAFIFLAGIGLWNYQGVLNFHHSLPFFIAAFIGLITTVVTVVLIKEKSGTAAKLDKFSFDFLRFPAVMKFFMVIFFFYLAHGCLTPFFVKYCVSYLKFDGETASIALLLLTIVGALFAYPIGVLSDKTSRKKVMLLGCLLYMAALSSGYFVKDIAGLYVIMSVIGIGFVTIQVVSYAALAELAPAKRLGEFMGIFNFFISISQFIANNLMGFMLDRIGWTVYFPLAAALMLMAAFILALSKLEKHPAVHQTTN